MSNFIFKCDCPDASKSKTYVLNRAGYSYEDTRDWSSSDAGAQNGECKHIWALKIQLGLVGEGDIPTDIPTTLYDKIKSKEKEMYGQAYRGNTFKSKENFSIPDIDRYKPRKSW